MRSRLAKVVLVLVGCLFSRSTLARDDQTDWEVPPQPLALRDSQRCNLWKLDFGSQLPSYCSTPRFGWLSGGYVALDAGIHQLRGASQRRDHLGLGASVEARVGVELWDRLVLGIGFGSLFEHDDAPTTELVMRCDVVHGEPTNCGEAELGSSQASAVFFAYEAGYQHRVRPARHVSVAPGLLLGFMQVPHGLVREVVCEGCEKQRLEAEPGGLYLLPFVRLTMGQRGNYAFVLRSRLFLMGDSIHSTTLGFEYGRP